MQIYYIRHGQSANNQLFAASGSYQGRSEDPLLTELGLQQAELLAAHIANNSYQMSGHEVDDFGINDFNLTHVYTSLMTRAVSTASVISKKLQIPMIGLLDLHECGGIFLEDEVTGELCGKKGKPPAQLRSEFPELILPENLPDDGWWNRPYETHEEQIPRAYRLLESIIAKHGMTNNRIALIGHMSFFNDLIAAIFGLNERTPAWFELHNASITRLDYDERFTITYMNRTHFLPGEMIT